MVSKTAKDKRHEKLAYALQELLEAEGWKLAVVGSVTVQKPIASFQHNYQAVISFTGTEPKKKPAPKNPKEEK